MPTPNFLRAANDEIYENSTIVNSLDDIKNFLAAKNVKNVIIEIMERSFMAKIPDGTRVELVDNMLKVGKSTLKLGENIFNNTEKIMSIVSNMQNRALTILDKKPLAKVEKKPLVAANDENYRMAA